MAGWKRKMERGARENEEEQQGRGRGRPTREGGPFRAFPGRASGSRPRTAEDNVRRVCLVMCVLRVLFVCFSFFWQWTRLW